VLGLAGVGEIVDDRDDVHLAVRRELYSSGS